MTTFALKIIAIITMTIDHIGFVYQKSLGQRITIFGYDATLYYFLRVIGRISFPLYAFSNGIGFKYTKDLKKYITRLFLFAIFSQIIFVGSTLIPNYYSLNYLKEGYVNIIVTFLASAIGAYIYKEYRFYNKMIPIISILFLGFLCEMLGTDYGYIGVLMPFFVYIMDKRSEQILVLFTGLFYLYNKSKGKESIYLIISLLTIYFIKIYLEEYRENKRDDIIITIFTIFMTFGICLVYRLLEIKKLDVLFISSMISLIIIMFYNDKKGFAMKYFFYIYYPFHILILNLLPHIINIIR